MSVCAEDVVDFWIGQPPADAAQLRALVERWFGADARLDAQIRERFGPTMSAAAGEALDAWAASARGRLALIVLLDQFPRNIYRGTAEAFAQDAKALRLTLNGIEAAMDEELQPLERLFFYMPLQHAESADAQARSVETFDALARSPAAPFISAVLAGSADFARQHRDIIAEFGRFPHRNAVLGRRSTAEELRYLAQGGATFGQ